ncbi:hypothetical protein GJAV_G00056170 [Gymnothorax javanicus]|nr:hypothetical protein GJAV_G00056170 [Gymnothorax javanicus]
MGRHVRTISHVHAHVHTNQIGTELCQPSQDVGEQQHRAQGRMQIGPFGLHTGRAPPSRDPPASGL